MRNCYKSPTMKILRNEEFDFIRTSGINRVKTREEKWLAQERRDNIIINRNDSFSKQLKSAIMMCNLEWDMDTNPDFNCNRSTKERALNYLDFLTPDLFLENYYLFKAGNHDDIKDSIYTKRHYLVIETLIKMGVFIFESQNNLYILEEIICGDADSRLKILAQQILNKELLGN